MIRKDKSLRTTDWYGCYSGSLKGIISDAAFQHPAKFAQKLIQRIYKHGFKQGYWQEGNLVCDPFAGVSIGGIYAASYGLRWIGVELEEKFVKLAEESFKLHLKIWDKLGKPRPIILQGDSRQFSSIIGRAVEAIVTSPPYAEAHAGIESPGGILNSNRQDLRKWVWTKGTQGQTNGQIGAMKEGNLEEVVEAILTSPPYVDLAQRFRSQEPFAQAAPDGYGHTSPSRQVDGYSTDPNNLGNLPEGSHRDVVDSIVTSPPYSETATGHKPGTGFDSTEARAERLRAAGYDPDKILTPGRRAHGNLGEMEHYSDNPDNLGNLPEGDHEAIVQGIVTSPPFNERTPSTNTPGAYSERRGMEKLKLQEAGYRGTRGQIGDLGEGKTYWQAVAQVYQECWKVLKPGGVMVVVVKAFVRKGQIIDLPKQTEELLRAIGFVLLERIRAWLVSPAVQKALLPGVNGYRKERKSFFRRLAERKGAPRIDYEVVLFLRKPANSGV